mmetsp:Transcript_28140/g.63669  ORF Transcript_28140/g.63669 Transcript_28140/m.63669 type:complete len:164 (-) Transcript_28140:144-635(-)
MPVDSWTLAKLLDGKLDRGNEKNELGVLHSIIRSKGFIWLASHAQSALYWSHAGAHFALNPLGLWWAATPKENWPDAGDLSNPEVVKIAKEFDKDGKWGDRRQELVFIGVDMVEEEIAALFDACLLNDEEMQQFEELMKDKPNSANVRGNSQSPSGLQVEFRE